MKTVEWSSFQELPIRQYNKIYSLIQFEEKYPGYARRVSMWQFLYPDQNDELERKFQLLLQEYNLNEMDGSREQLSKYKEGVVNSMEAVCEKIKGNIKGIDKYLTSNEALQKELKRVGSIKTAEKLKSNDLFFLWYFRLNKWKEEFKNYRLAPGSGRQSSYTTIEEWFEPECVAKIDACILLLKNCDPPVIGAKNKYLLGTRKKGAIVAWITALHQRGYVKGVEKIASMINASFTGLDISNEVIGQKGVDKNGKTTSGYKTYYSDFYIAIGKL